MALMSGGKKISKCIIFLASPLLALPDIIYGIYRKSNFNLVLLSLFFGILSYLYVPNISNDRARYFEMYYKFSSYGLNDFVINVIKARADFILQGLVFIFSKAGISIQFLLLLVTSFTSGVWFYVFSKIADRSKLTKGAFFLCFILVLFSFSLPDLFSGLRFYFASAFLMLSFYNGFYQEKLSISLLCLVTAIFIHFSTLLFVPLYLCLRTFRYNYNGYRVLFLVSFVFVFLPKSFIASFVDVISFSEGYGTKAEVYLQGDDFIEGGISRGSASYIIVYTFSTVWSYFAYLYLILTIKRESFLRNLNYLFFGAVNIFYSVTTVYSRYLIILKFTFALLLISELMTYKNRKPVIIATGLFALNIINNLIVMRYNIQESFFNTDIFLLLTILFKSITLNDFIH